MVMHRHSKFQLRKARILLSAFVWTLVSALIVSCESGDNAGAVEASDAGTAGMSTSGDSVVDDGPPIPTPIAVRLQTQEELPVSGAFALARESAGVEFPQQQYTVVDAPSHGTLIHLGQSRQFTYLPEKDFFGTDFFTYAIDTGISALVTLEVENVNDAPTIFAEVQGVVEQGIAYSAAIIGNDPDNDALIYRATNLPSWLSLDSSTGLLNGTPNMSDVGLFENIGFSVTDTAGLFSEVTDVRIEVIELNDAPNINIDQFPTRLDAGEAIQVHLFPDDPDDDPVAVTFEPNDLLDVKVASGTVDVIAAEVSQVTDVNLVLLATDVRGGATRAIVPFTLYPMNSTGRGRTVHGRDGNGAGVHLVVLGDGYREDQQARFREHVETLIEKMQADIGMQTHFSAWNVHMVETPSVDSGIDDNLSRDTRDTVYSTGYFCKQVRRLICGDKPKMYNVAINEYPNFDQILVLVNDSRYGGSGGNIAISSTESIEIALHEMGHSIAGLADEYVDQYIPVANFPTFVEGRFANVSASSDPAVVPWRHWLENNTAAIGETTFDVGIYEGAYYRADGFFRPTPNSLMRNYDGELGPVNGEQWALSVYARANPVLEISPVSRLLTANVGEVLEFSVEPMFNPAIQSVEWQLDSRVIPDSGAELPSVSLSFPEGTYELAVTVRDVSGLIRKPEPHAGVFAWNWTVVVQ